MRILLWCVGFLSCLIVSESLSPVVFIPGSPDVSLQINIVGEVDPPEGCPNSGSYVAFGNDTFQSLENGACFYYYLAIVYDANSQTFSNRSGVEVSVVLPTEPDDQIFSTLQKLGYTFGKDYFLAVYDWRLSPNLDTSFFLRTKLMIETAYATNGNQKVHIIGHSTGGGMTFGFLTLSTQEWKDTYIASAITLSGNLAGEIDIFADLTILSSDFNGVSNNISRMFWWTQPAEAWQLPHPGIYPSDKIVVKTPTHEYSAFDVMNVLRTEKANPMLQWYNKTGLWNITGNFTFPGVDYYCLWGEGVPTVVGYHFKVEDFSQEPGLMLGDGDGDQDIITNSACKRWESQDLQNHTFSGKGFIGVTHMGMTTDKRVMDYVIEILQKSS